MDKRRQFIKKSVVTGIGIAANVPAALAGSTHRKNSDINLGIIGLDTSHSPAFAKYINDPDRESMQGVKVIAAYPYGSQKIESSAKKIPEYTQELKELGVTIVDELGNLIEQVDGILLETNDGTLHLEQALQVIEAGKPLFIDKPVAAGLEDVISIYEAAKAHNVPLFSSSSLRYINKAQEVRHNQSIGKVIGASTYSPEDLEPSHTDLFWYGIHGVEILYTVMGTGCQRIRRITTENTDLVIGVWNDDRIGTFRGILEGPHKYGGTAYGTNDVVDLGSFEGYGPLVEKIIEFFETEVPPVSAEETLELYTFMEAADVSKQRNGDWVDIKKVYDKAAKASKG